ncbi:MAG: NINE protein [Micropruina sp.]|uniref:TM2 domain-containing protein n=1 Tax=Micropruina sp. TaxID=2737536 RepID=UPI0039E333C8
MTVPYEPWLPEEPRWHPPTRPEPVAPAHLHQPQRPAYAGHPQPSRAPMPQAHRITRQPAVRAAAGAKSTVVAYLLLLLLGLFGTHHFYLNRPGWGMAYLLTTVLFGPAYGLGLILAGIGCAVDLFLLPRHTRDANRRRAGHGPR